VFTTAHHWSLSWAICIQSTRSHSVSLRSILILSFHLRVCPHSDFSTRILYALLISSIRATCPTHLILVALIALIIIGEAYKLRCSTLCSLLQPSDTSSLLGQHIPITSLYRWTTHNYNFTCCFVCVRNLVSHAIPSFLLRNIFIIIRYHTPSLCTVKTQCCWSMLRPSSPWSWRQLDPPKRWYPATFWPRIQRLVLLKCWQVEVERTHLWPVSCNGSYFVWVTSQLSFVMYVTIHSGENAVRFMTCLTSGDLV
jgi:hypothetical protein